MIREYTIRLDDTLKGFQDDVDELERRFDAEEKQGQWVFKDGLTVCSKCACSRTFGISNYCANCGAKMSE